MNKNKAYSTQCINVTLNNICAKVNRLNIGKKGPLVFQVWYNSISTTIHITRTKLEKLLEALGMVSIVKLSKETMGYSWSPSFYEC